MIKWVSFILQMLMLKSSLTKSMTTLDYVQRTAERIRGYFLFMVGSTLSAFLLMASLIVGVIGVGTQIEKQGSVQFTGLILSSTIFFILATGIFLISLIILGFQKKKMAEEMIKRQKQSGSHSMMNLAEEILKQILLNLSNPKPRQETERPRNQSEETI